ncbi:MAG: hypothetical protein ACXAEN_26930, partial [Candidatus Thorarchaeota archaeon]
ADGEVIELDGLGTHKDGFRIARTKQGRLLEVRQQEADPVQRVSTRRALGIVFGTLASPFAAGWGFIRGTLEHTPRIEEEAKAAGRTTLDSMILGSIGGVGYGMIEAIESAGDAAFKEGSWGARFTDAVEAVTGRSFRDNLNDLVKLEQDPAEKSRLKTTYNTIAGVGVDTLELLIEAGLEGGAVAGPRMIREVLKHGSHLKAVQAGVEGRIAEQGIKKYGAQLEKEAFDLLQNRRQELVTVLDTIRRKSAALGIDQTREVIAKEIKKQVGQRRNLLQGSFDWAIKAPKDAVENVKRLWGLEAGMEQLRGVEKGLQRTAEIQALRPAPRKEFLKIARRVSKNLEPKERRRVEKIIDEVESGDSIVRQEALDRYLAKPTITLESSGLQTIFETIQQGMRRTAGTTTTLYRRGRSGGKWWTDSNEYADLFSKGDRIAGTNKFAHDRPLQAVEVNLADFKMFDPRKQDDSFLKGLSEKGIDTELTKRGYDGHIIIGDDAPPIKALIYRFTEEGLKKVGTGTPTTTLEAGGLQTVIEKGTKAVKGLWDGWQNTYINSPTEQADDVIDMVRDILKHEYKPLVTKAPRNQARYSKGA